MNSITRTGREKFANKGNITERKRGFFSVARGLEYLSYSEGKLQGCVWWYPCSLSNLASTFPTTAGQTFSQPLLAKSNYQIPVTRSSCDSIG